MRLSLHAISLGGPTDAAKVVTCRFLKSLLALSKLMARPVRLEPCPDMALECE